MPKLVVIVGPTASGKSALAVAVAKVVSGEVISADSRQVYSGLDIGTGKITTAEMQGIPHHLLDVADPNTIFTADDFARGGHITIAGILERGNVPIIAGGTGFYIDALVGRITLPAVPPNPQLREELSGKSAPELFAMLQAQDPERAATIDPHNPHRLIRALEIATALGTSPKPQVSSRYDVLWIGINPDLETLYQKIHSRLLERLEAGMVAEAEKLHANGLSYERMHNLGLEYHHLARFLEGVVDADTMQRELETDIRQYAKRQLTYWKRNKEIHWYPTPTLETILPQVQTFLNAASRAA